MTLKEIIYGVEKPDNPEWCNLESILSEFEMYSWPEKENTLLTSCFYAKWYCTDTYVGGRVYFLGERPVAISWQSARKSDEKFTWVSKDAMIKTRDYLLTLFEDQAYNCDVDDIDMTQEMGIGYPVEYGSQLLTDEVIHVPTSENVKVVKTWDRMDDIKKWRYIEVEFEDGHTEEVFMDQILVPYNVKN